MATTIGGVLAGLAVLAGCGATTPPPDASAPTPASPSVAPSSGPAPSGTASPAPGSSSARDGAGAADGTDLDACRDGSCEVAVRSGTVIPLDPRFGVERLLVSRVGGGSAKLEQTEEGGHGSNTASGGRGATITMNDVTVTVERVDGDVAVIALSS